MILKIDLDLYREKDPFTNGLFINGKYAVVDNKSIIEYPIKLFGGINAPYLKYLGAITYSWSHLSLNIKSIGRFCSIASNVIFGPADHPLDWLTTSNCSWDPNFWKTKSHDTFGWNPYIDPRHLNKREAFIEIGNDVWIGQGVIIKQGINIGHGAVIGAGAVVTKDVEPYSVMAGVPARTIKMRFDSNIIERLLKLQWWEFDLNALNQINLKDSPEKFCDDLENLDTAGFGRNGYPISKIDDFTIFK